MGALLLFKDKAGNRLYKKYVKTRGVWQYFGKNAEGRIVNEQGVKTLARRAGISLHKRRCGKTRKTRVFNYNDYNLLR